MPNNISKYVQLTNFCLLEYEFNRDAELTALNTPYVGTNEFGTKQFYEADSALGITNNIWPLNSIPTNTQRTNWFTDASTYDSTYPPLFDVSLAVTQATYACDTVKVHIVSGYNFEDVDGFLLQIRAKDASDNLTDLTNFTYAKQSQTLGSDVIKFSGNILFLGNRYYDKYVKLKVPSVQTLSGDTTALPALGKSLDIALLSDVYLTYSSISQITDENEYSLNELINFQLPVTSVADNFNCYIAESTLGDFIEYYATWNDLIIGNYIGEIESGKIQLYTSNNPNDNYNEFATAYGTAAKWVVIHEITVTEQIAGANLITQQYSFTQDNNFATPNYFRPILQNADIASSYNIQYTCRLMNRMDGTQIIRKASFSSVDPKKYGLKFTRLNIDNIIPYKVFNKIEPETPNTQIKSGVGQVKYAKVYYDTTRVILDSENNPFPQGTGPLFLKSNDSVYKFKFEKIDTNNNRVNCDLSGSYNYLLVFKLKNNTKIEVGPTYSTNMNTTIGEIEFKLNSSQITKLFAQTNNNFSIIIKNPNGTEYTFYEGVFYNYADTDSVLANYSSLFTVTDAQSTIATLQSEVNRLTDENAALKTT